MFVDSIKLEAFLVRSQYIKISATVVPEIKEYG